MVFGGIDRARLAIVRALYCPVPGIPTYVPIIGGRGIAELVVIMIMILVILILAIASEDTAGGKNAEIIGVVLIILAMRNNFVLQFIGMPVDYAIVWHKVLGVVMLLSLAIHGIRVGLNSSGLALAILVGCNLLSYLVMARLDFRLFYYPHVLIYFLIIIFAKLHGAEMLSLSGIVFGVDILCRVALVGKQTTSKVEVLSDQSCTVITVPMPANSMSAGKYAFLMVKDVNFYEFHPFSAIPQKDSLVFYVRNCGDWTSELAKKATGKTDLSVFVEGPYGALQVDFDNFGIYKECVLIAGGVGITAVFPVFANLVKKARSSSAGAAKLSLVWVVREKTLLLDFYTRMLGPLLADDGSSQGTINMAIERQQDDDKLHLRSHHNSSVDISVQLYLTSGALSPTEAAQLSTEMLQSGRPVWSALMSSWTQQSVGDRVAMMVCGPGVMMDEVQGLADRSNNTLGLFCSEQSGKKATIDYHIERFQL